MTDLTLVRGACPHDCPDTCGTVTEVKDGQAIRFYAEPQHPVTEGWLCAKVRPYLERVYAPDRLLYPMRRSGPKGGGQWQQISWDAAIEEIAERWRQIIDRPGPAAILPYSYSGTIGMLQMAVASERLWNRMGVSGLERSICGAAAELAVNLTLGGRLAPEPQDVLESKLVLIWGHNPASTGPHFMPLLRQAQRRGAQVIVIDPRRTITARSANLHIQPRPATDGALALGLMHVIFRDGLHDEAWLRANSLGWEELRERAAAFDPQRVAAISGIAAEVIEDLARRYATTKPALLKFADGIQRHGNGGQTVRALCCLPALVGQYGVRGGGLNYSASGWYGWDGEAISHASECPPPPRVINMNQIGSALLETQDPPIQSLFVFGANPVGSAPNASKIVQGLQREDLFTVVHEQFMTDTAQYADLVLPATTFLEHVDLNKAYGHPRISYNTPAIAPRGECVSNWDLMRKLAAAMGYSEPWLQQSADEVIDEVLTATAAKTPAMAHVSLAALKTAGSLALTLPGDGVPFADGHFPTPSGKIELRCERMRTEHGLDELPDYTPPAEFQERKRHRNDETTIGELVLISGASHHYVSSSFANQPSLMAKEGRPFVEISPADAAARQIADGDTVRVQSARGWVELRAVVTDDVPPGVAVAPKGPWARLSPGGRNINWTTPDTLADLAGQSTFHSNLVQIERV